MLDCPYFKKEEFDFETLIDKLDEQDTKKIAEKMGVSYPIVKQYISKEKKYAHIRVPQFFIDAATDIIAERKQHLEEVKKKIDQI